MNAASCPEMLQDLQASPPDLTFQSISSPELVPGSSTPPATYPVKSISDNRVTSKADLTSLGRVACESSFVCFSPLVMESDSQGTISTRALSHAQGRDAPSPNCVKRPGSLNIRAARALLGPLPPDPRSYTEQMITNYLHMRQVLANGGGSYKPHLWPEPQRNPPWDKTPTVYSGQPSISFQSWQCPSLCPNTPYLVP